MIYKAILPCFMLFVAQIGAGAATVNPEATIASILLAYGPLGIMVLWFMWRNEAQIKALNQLSHRIDGMSQVQLIDVISRESTGPYARKAAEDLLTKIASRNEKGK